MMLLHLLEMMYDVAPFDGNVNVKYILLKFFLFQKMESLFLLKKNQNLKLTVPRSQKWGRRRENLLTLKSMLSCDNT